MWDSFKEWLSDLGEFLYRVGKTSVGQFMKKYGKTAYKIVAEVATSGGTGKEKFAKASAMLLLEAPGAFTYLIECTIQAAYEIWKADQEKIDTDGDGVPDYRDACKTLGAPVGGCVTADGCPDSDCDGVPDADDKCPTEGNQGCGVDANGCPIPCDK